MSDGLEDASDRVRRRLRRRTTKALVAALCLVVIIRLLPFPTVYRQGDVVLSSNDPYFYRYLVEQMTVVATGPLDLGVLTSLPSITANGEPLLTATLWWVAELFGGQPWTTGTILAWYPVVSAVLTGVLVYLLVIELSDDPRVALAAVVFFAVVPGHAFRTGLGFADHHAFDYLWLTVTAFAFIRLIGDDRIAWPWSRQTILGVALLGVGVGGQVLAWEAGPLLLVPLALGLIVYAPFAAHRDEVSAFVAIVAGLAVGAILTGIAHAGLGWHSFAVAVTPALLCVGGFGLLVGVVTVSRFDLPPYSLAIAEAVSLTLVGTAVRTAVPAVTVALDRGLAFLRSPATAGEMQSITANGGPVFGPLIMLGFTPFLAVPAMVWSAWESVRRADPGWLLLNLYGWTFLGLSLVQRRFTGELAPFIAIFAGLGFVGLCSMLDLLASPTVFPRTSRSGGISRSPESDTSTPRQGTGTDAAERTASSSSLELPGRRRGIVLGSLGIVFTVFPALYSALIHPRVTIDDRKHAAARWMQQYAEARSWEYPANYVFSNWGRNRMYNYFVNGESQSYGFAQQNYDSFLSSQAPVEWYDRLRSRVGFVVTTADAQPGGIFGDRMYDRLHGSLGSRRGGTPGLDHYRAVYASDDGYVKVFTLVPGATVVGRGPANTELSVQTDVTIPGGTFTYERQVTTDETGSFSVTVSQSGTYRIAEAEVDVPEATVTEAQTVEVGDVT